MISLHHSRDTEINVDFALEPNLIEILSQIYRHLQKYVYLPRERQRISATTTIRTIFFFQLKYILRSDIPVCVYAVCVYPCLITPGYAGPYIHAS